MALNPSTLFKMRFHVGRFMAKKPYEKLGGGASVLKASASDARPQAQNLAAGEPTDQKSKLSSVRNIRRTQNTVSENCLRRGKKTTSNTNSHHQS
jgi:hypothetical protein